MKPIAFVDCETTGTDSDRHTMWELALIRPDLKRTEDNPPSAFPYFERLFLFDVDLTNAASEALRVGRYYKAQQTRDWALVPEARYRDIARTLAELTAGCYLAGNTVHFDERFLEKFLRTHGSAPAWDYHLLDVTTLGLGALHSKLSTLSVDLKEEREDIETALESHSSRTVAKALGLDRIPDEDLHSALGDARQAVCMYEHVAGVKFGPDEPIQ